jgi:hypothetical protein
MEYQLQKMMKIIQVKKFNLKKKLYWKTLNTFYNWIVNFMVAYFLVFILILLWHFLNPHFSFCVCDKHSVIISNVHNESILFLKLIYNF